MEMYIALLRKRKTGCEGGMEMERKLLKERGTTPAMPGV